MIVGEIVAVEFVGQMIVGGERCIVEKEESLVLVAGRRIDYFVMKWMALQVAAAAVVVFGIATVVEKVEVLLLLLY